jgi:ligand-binding SRPBCC domain-containing protein
MAVYSFKVTYRIPAPRERVWDFFSSAANLQAITPPYMKFRIISKHRSEKIYPGQLIEYKLTPVLGIPVYWMTEITHVREPEYFVDIQRFGPYNMWQHQHHFAAIDGGTEMTDIVHYRNPMWLLGDLANVLFVKKQLRKIFEYREKRVEEIFGKWQESEK